MEQLQDDVNKGLKFSSISIMLVGKFMQGQIFTTIVALTIFHQIIKN